MDCLLERRGNVALVTMNRPESLNALGGNTVPLMHEYLTEAAMDDDVRAVVLTGAGRGFCSGGDMKGGGQMGPNLDGPAVLMKVPLLLHTMPKPTIAAVNGAAAGAGFGLALSCDMRIAARSAKFLTAYRHVGLAGDFGTTYFLQRQVGYGRAFELFMTGERISAERALGLGIVNHVVDDDKVVGKAVEFGQWIADGFAWTTARMKESLLHGAFQDPWTGMRLEGANHRMSGQESRGEGQKRFREGSRQEPFSWE